MKTLLKFIASIFLLFALYGCEYLPDSFYDPIYFGGVSEIGPSLKSGKLFDVDTSSNIK